MADYESLDISWLRVTAWLRSRKMRRTASR